MIDDRVTLELGLDLRTQAQAVGAARDDIRPQLAAGRDRSSVRCGLVGSLMAVAERGAADPRLERLLVTPARHDEPDVAIVGRLQQLESFEAVLVVDRTRTCREPFRQLVATVGRDGDRVDLDDLSHLRRQAGSGMSVGSCTSAVGCPVDTRPSRRDLGDRGHRVGVGEQLIVAVVGFPPGRVRDPPRCFERDAVVVGEVDRPDEVVIDHIGDLTTMRLQAAPAALRARARRRGSTTGGRTGSLSGRARPPAWRTP